MSHGTNDHLHEKAAWVPARKMGPGYKSEDAGMQLGASSAADPVSLQQWLDHRSSVSVPTLFTPAPITDPAFERVPCVRVPDAATARKQRPIATGVLDYFPDAVAAVAHLSFVGNEQHNPGQPLHWDRSKSTDEADALIRHFLQRGTTDGDGIAHSAKVAWRALALLQKEIEAAREPAPAAECCCHTNYYPCPRHP